MMSIQIDTYKDCILSIKCGSYQGSVINAKPILILSVIEGIEKTIIQNNKIPFSKDLELLYKELFIKYGLKVTPFFKPFFYLQFDNFWHLKWKTKEYSEAHPSAMFIRNNIEYAFLDNALWDILQEAETRDYFRNAIINSYLK